MRKAFFLSIALTLAGCTEKTSEEHLESARQYLAQNDTSAAIVELKNAVRISPTSAQIRYQLGRLYFQQQEFENAEKELSRAMDLGYDSAQIVPMLSEAYRQTKAHVALITVDHANSDLSVNEQLKVGFYKLESLVQLEKNTLATALAAELLTLDSHTYYKALVQAYEQILQQNYQDALGIVEQTRIDQPSTDDVLKLQARLLLELERADDAANVYLDYIEHYPDDHQIKFVVAKLLIDQSRMQEAEPLIDQLLVLSPNNMFLNQMKALVSASKEEFELALTHAEIAIQQGSNDPGARLVAGLSAYQQQKYQAASLHLSMVASSLPDNHPGLKILAASQLQLGETVEAVDVLGRLAQISEQDAALFSRASYELLSSGYVKQAEQMVARTAEVSQSAQDLARLGALKLSLNNVEGILNLEQAVEQAPDYEPAQITLAKAYILQGDLDKAQSLADAWLQNSPDNEQAYLLQSNIFLKAQKYTEAMASVQKALAIAPQSSDLKMLQINILQAQGKSQAAQQALQSLLQTAPDYLPALATHFLLQGKDEGFESAIAPALAAATRDPNNTQLNILLARMYATNRDFTQTLAFLERITPDQSTPKAYWLIKGQALLFSGRFQQASEHYQAWIARDRYDKDAVLGSLLLMDNRNKFADALALASDFLDKRDDLQMQILQTHFLLLNRQFDDARVNYQDFSAEVKALPFVRGMRARLQILDEDISGALSNATAAFEANRNWRNLLLVVFCLEKLQQSDRAMSMLEQYAADNPKQTPALMVLAERQIQRDTAAAMQTYESILTLAPDNYVVLNNLAFLYKQQGDLTRARDLAVRAVEIKPESVEALDTLAQIYVANKALDDAAEYYARMDIDELTNEEILLNYLEVLLKTNNNRLALRYMEDRTLQQPASQQRWAQLKQQYQL